MLEQSSNNLKSILHNKDFERIISFSAGHSLVFKRLLGKGFAGIVFLAEKGKKKFAVKMLREKSRRNNLIGREFRLLKELNRHGIGPRVFEADDEFSAFSMEFVQGVSLNEFLQKEKSGERIFKVVKNLFRQAVKLDELKIKHGQLAGALTNVIVTPELKVKIIDFEKAVVLKERKSKNVNQLLGELFFNPHSLIAGRLREKIPEKKKLELLKELGIKNRLVGKTLRPVDSVG